MGEVLDSSNLLFNREYTSRSKIGRPTFSLRDSMNRECLGSSNVITNGQTTKSDRVYGATFTPFPTRENHPPRSDDVVTRKSFAFDEKSGGFRNVMAPSSLVSSNDREKIDNSHYSTSSGWKRRAEKDAECCKNCHLCTQSHTTDKWALTSQERQLRPETTSEPTEGYYSKNDEKQYRPYSPDTKSMMQKLVGYKENPQDSSLPMYRSTHPHNTPTVGYYMNRPVVETSTKQMQPNTYPKNPSQMQPYNTNTIYLSNNPISVKSVTLNSKYDPASRYTTNPDEPNNFFKRVRMGRMYSDSTPWEYYLHYNEDDDEKKEMYDTIRQRCSEYAKNQTKKEDRKSRICMETSEFKNIVEKLTRKETNTAETQTVLETVENKENISISATIQGNQSDSKKSKTENQSSNNQSVESDSQTAIKESSQEPSHHEKNADTTNVKKKKNSNNNSSISSTTESTVSSLIDSKENRALSTTNGPPSTKKRVTKISSKKNDIPKGVPVYIPPKKSEVVKKIVTNITSNKKMTTSKKRKKSTNTEPRNSVSQNTTSNSSYIVSDKAVKSTTTSASSSKKPDNKFKKTMKRIEDTKKKAEWLDKYIALLSSPEKTSVKKRMESSSRHTSPKKSDSSQITLRTSSDTNESNPYSYDFDEVYSGLPSTVSTAIATSKSVQKCFDSVLNYFEKSKYKPELSTEEESSEELDDNVSLSSMASDLEISVKYNISTLSSEYDEDIESEDEDSECSILNEFTPDTSYLVDMNNGSSESISMDTSYNTVSIGSNDYSSEDVSREFNISNMSM